jgi:hypothetical protein
VTSGGPATALAQGGKPAKDVPVVSTLNDAGAVTPDPGSNHRIQSDGAGAYFDGVARVVSEIQVVGDWVMDASSSTSRAVLLDFREPVDGTSTSSAPFDWQVLPARLISKCTQSLSGGYPAIPVGTTVNCPLHAAFKYAGVSYAITMNPLNDGATSYVRVTCDSGDANGQCNHWTIAPVTQADSSVRSVAVLLRQTTVKGKITNTVLGYYYMTFHIEVAKP